MFTLSDDGTLDTVLTCSECGQDERYNYDPSGGRTLSYNQFVLWSIKDAEDIHECIDIQLPLEIGE